MQQKSNYGNRFKFGPTKDNFNVLKIAFESNWNTTVVLVVTMKTKTKLKSTLSLKNQLIES